MLNTQIKFDSKIRQFKSYYIHKELHKMFKFQFDLECQGQGHQFSNTSEIFSWSLNSLSVKAKFQIGQFKV